MKPSKWLGIGLVLLAAQLSAFSAEIAVLRNGFTIHFDHKEQNGDTTRLFTRGGFVDVATADIASFEADDTPDVPAAQPAPGTQAAPAAQPTAPPSQVSSLAQSGLAQPGMATTSFTPATRLTGQVDLDQVVREASNRYQLDPDFVNSVIKAESNFQPRAVSRKGAQGLMQLMPATASLLGVRDPFDPKANVEAGTAYLSQLLDQYHNDPIKALAAYNAGANRVDRYHGVPPYMETRAYVARIVRDYNAKKRAQMKAAQAIPVKTAKKKKKAAPAQPQEASVAKTKKPA